MYTWVKRITLLSCLVFSISAACANDDDSRVDAFPYSNLKIFPHWLIGCNNLEECSAVGYPRSASEEDAPFQPWYITAAWHKDSDIIDFSFSDWENKNNGYDNISIKLCDEAKHCRSIGANDKLTISTKEVPNGIEKTVKFVLDTKHLSINSYINYSADKNISAEKADDPIYFKEFLQNHNSININYLPQLGGKEKIYNIKHIVESYGVNGVTEKIYPQYDTSMNGWDDDHPEDCLSLDHSVEYENGDKFIFGCVNQGFSTQVGKYNGKIYKDFNVVDDATFNITGGGSAGDNMFGRIYFPDDAKQTFEVNNKGRGASLCSVSYDFAYNGKKFIIETIRYMPLCMNILIQDWPVVYQRPS